MAVLFGNPVTTSAKPPATVATTSIIAKATSRSSTYLAMAFQSALRTPAPMTITVTKALREYSAVMSACDVAFFDGEMYQYYDR